MSQREERIEGQKRTLWESEGDWFEFLQNFAFDIENDNQVKLAFQNLRIRDDKAFRVIFEQAYDDWCERMAIDIVDTKG